MATEDLPDVAKSELDAYKHNVTKLDANLKSVAALYIDDACDLLVKFNAAAFAGKKLIIDTVDVTGKVETVGEQAVYRIEELLPQQWKHMYDIQVIDGENTVCHFTYGVMSYIRGQLSKNTEAKTGLKNLLKSMYAYSTAAIAYADQEMPDGVISYDPVSEVYTVKGESDGAAEGFYSTIISTEASMAFSIEAEMTIDQGGYTTGMGFVLEQDGNKVLFTYASLWDIGVIVEDDGVLDLNNTEDELASVIYGGLAGDISAFDTAGSTVKLKLVYDYANVYLMIWNGTQWKQIPNTAYPITNAGGTVDGVDGVFNIQKGFNVGIGTLVGYSDHKGEKTGGGTVRNVVYTNGQAEIEYTNTLNEFMLRDTYIFKDDDGTYYLYGTQYFPTLQVWSSTDKVNWKTEGTGYFCPADGDYNVTTDPSSYEYACWAPEVYKIDGEYVMIATFTENGTDENDKTNVVLKSSSPTGPFTISHEIAPGNGGNYYLDGTLYEENGQKYLIFADQDSSYMMYVKLNDDLTVASGASATNWFKNTIIGNNAAVMDGPEVYTDANGQKWLLWSTFPNGMGDYDSYTQYATKFTKIGDTMSKSNTVTLYTGGGHGMILEDGDQDYLVMHAPNSSPRTNILPVYLNSSGNLTLELTATTEYEDKLLGGWLGQMLGVDRGYPNEFNNNATLVDDSEIKAMSDVDPNSALGQDDLYVEIPFLQAMSANGYDCDGSYLAEAFKNTTFGLWHANLWGRTNLQNGIAYPDSGSYLYNQCAEDIDWQIESDFLGMMYPGQPSAAAAKAFELGHIMNYGDGVYGGVFVAAMHAQAYTATSLEEIWTAGIQVIPEGTQFRALLDDVLANYNNGMTFADNWAAINAKWIPTAMCFAERNGCTIDAKLNSGYVLMALLYASSEDGIYNQIDKATYYAIKCGMDTDCNASTVASVLGNYYGYEAMQAVFNYELDWNSTFSETSVTLTQATQMNIDLMNAVLSFNSTPETTITPVTYEQVPDGVYVYLNALDAPNGRNLHLDSVVIRTKNAEPVSYEVNYGDGTVHTGTYYQRTHIYAADGTYTLTFTVNDSLGQSHTATATVTVSSSANTYTAISSLSQITDLSGSYVLSGNITGNTTTISGFTGKLDGNGHTIETSVALFDGIDSTSAVVENLNIVLTGDLSGTGILSSGQINWARIENVHISAANGAKLNATGNAGAIAPSAAHATLIDCSNAVEIVGSNYLGGMLGTIQAVNLFGCKNSGAITASGNEAGGIVGRSTWETNVIKECVNSGTIAATGSSNTYAGGIVGHAVFGSLSMNDCKNSGTVTAEANFAGGLVACADYSAVVTAIDCSNSGAVSAPFAGGIIGRIQGSAVLTADRCVNDENGTVTGTYVGGILGSSNEGTVTITSCTNNEMIIGSNADSFYGGSGGIMGSIIENNTVTIKNCVNNADIVAPGGTTRDGILGNQRNGTYTPENNINNGTVLTEVPEVPTEYSISYENLQGADNSANPTTYTSGTAASSVVLADLADIDGYEFAGWSVGATGGTVISTLAGQSGDLVLYANWVSSATPITSLSEITDMSGSYCLAGNITGNTTTISGFTGSLNGEGYTIETSVPLFDQINSANVTIQNLNVKLTATLSAYASYDGLTTTGILANDIRNFGLIKNVHITADDGVTVNTTAAYVGGIAGILNDNNSNTSNVINCSNSVDITTTGMYAGGIAGYMSQGGNVISCSNSGNITAGTAAGGIVGSTLYPGTLTLTDCQNSGTITCSGSFGGGILGLADLDGRVANVNNCTNTGTINASHGGGIVGRVQNSATLTVENSVNGESGKTTGAVNGGGYVGGILGSAYNGTMTITGCTNYAAVTGVSMDYCGAGGIMGSLLSNTANITNCTNYGAITAPGSSINDGILGTNVWGTYNGSGNNGNATLPSEEEYAISYENMEGVDNSANPTTYTAETAATTILQPLADREGFDFAGWSIGSAGGTIVTDLTGQTGDLVIYANWITVPITITSLQDIIDKGLDGNYRMEGNITENTTTISGFTGTLDGQNWTIETSVTLFDSIQSSNVVIENLNIVLTGDLTGSHTDTWSGANLTTRGILANDISDAGRIENVHITASNGAKVNAAADYVGGFAGIVNFSTNANGKFINCSNAVDITGGAYVGGIGGYTGGQYGCFEDCSNSGSITANTGAGGILGGALWQGTVTFTNCANSGTINCANSFGGGILGVADQTDRVAKVSSCTNTGTINASHGGGIVGRVQNSATLTVENSVNGESGKTTGAVNGGGYVGGILGSAYNGTMTITGCTNYAAVTGVSMEYCGAGGIMGSLLSNTANITNCTNYGAITAPGSAINDGILGTCVWGTYNASENTNNGTVTN